MYPQHHSSPIYPSTDPHSSNLPHDPHSPDLNHSTTSGQGQRPLPDGNINRNSDDVVGPGPGSTHSHSSGGGGGGVGPAGHRSRSLPRASGLQREAVYGGPPDTDENHQGDGNDGDDDVPPQKNYQQSHNLNHSHHGPPRSYPTRDLGDRDPTSSHYPGYPPPNAGASRPWSRTGYHNDPNDSYYPPPSRGNYYNDYNPGRNGGGGWGPMSMPPGGPPMYPQGQRYGPMMGYDYSTSYEPYPQNPAFGRPMPSYYHQLPQQNFNMMGSAAFRPNPQQLKEYLQEFRSRDPSGYKEWYKRYKMYLDSGKTKPFPQPPGFGSVSTAPMMAMSQQNQRERMMSSSMQGPGHADFNTFDDGSDHNQSRPPRSGRSSVNGSNSIYNPSSNSDWPDLSINDYSFQNQPPIDMVTERSSPQRMTPEKFINKHPLGLITPMGLLVKLNENSNMLEVRNIKGIINQESYEVKLLKHFPGPLEKGITHKNNVIKFCHRKIQEIKDSGEAEDFVDSDSLILIWELLILLLKQNGSVVGSDISELLLKKNESEFDERELESDTVDGNIENETRDEEVIKKNEYTVAKLTEKFTNLLLYGHNNDALEFAMSSGLWGHALFLASKLGEKEYNRVMLRFANGLPISHPLQTLYQVLSGKVPHTVTSSSSLGTEDSENPSWKSHLSMIIANPAISGEVKNRAVIQLGDSLGSKPQYAFHYAAQFCYLLSSLPFKSSSRLGSLLGLNPTKSNIIYAYQMTEIYEFATSLGSSSVETVLAAEFLEHKFEYSKNFISYGEIEIGMKYLEAVGKGIVELYNTCADEELQQLKQVKWGVESVCERIWSRDAAADTEWIEELKKLGSVEPAAQYPADTFEDRSEEEQSNQPPLENQNTAPNPQDIQNSNADPYYETQHPSQYQINSDQSQPAWQQEQQAVPANQYEENISSGMSALSLGHIAGDIQSTNQHQSEQQNSYPNYMNGSYGFDQQQQEQYPSNPAYGYEQQTQIQPNATDASNMYPPNYLTNSTNQQQPLKGYSDGTQQQSMGNNYPGAYQYPENRQPQQQSFVSQPQPIAPVGSNSNLNTKKSDEPKKQQSKSTKPSGGGWLSSIFKFKSNQMILPDDKNPSIVWDPDQKRWVNQNPDEADDSGGNKPLLPPKDSELNNNQPPFTSLKPQMGLPNPGQGMSGYPTMENPGQGMPGYPAMESRQTEGIPMNPQSQQQPGLNPMPAPPTAANNKYKLPKGRGGGRPGYVDVFKPIGANQTQNSNQQQPGPPIPGLGNPSQPLGLPVSNGMIPNTQSAMFVPSPVDMPQGNNPYNFLSSHNPPEGSMQTNEN